MKQRTYLHNFYSPSKTAKDSMFYIESAGHYWCDKSFFEDSYYKQNYYMIYVVSGKGYVYNHDEPILVTPGQLAFINLSEPYKLHSHKKEPWEFLWMIFGGKDADWFYTLITGRNKQIFTLPAAADIPGYLLEINRLYENKDAFVEMRTHGLVTNILTSLYVESKKEMNIKQDREFELPNPVKTVMSYVEQNYFRKIALDELAAATFLNPYYLLKLFKKYTGYTPGEYINKFRIDYSKQLLLKPEMTVEQIALFLGFNTHSYFSKIFKKATGLTPQQFRKIYDR